MTRGIETLQNSHVQHAPCGGVEHAGNAHQASKLALPSISSPPTNSRRSHMLLVEDRAAEPINAQGTSRRVHTTSMQRNADLGTRISWQMITLPHNNRSAHDARESAA
jgi:hypothetical protein